MRFTLGIFFLLILNGCAQNTALFGPIYTIGTTGNALQAGVSYGTSYAIKEATGKNVSENISSIFKKNKVSTPKNTLETNPEEFFTIVKNYIKRSNKVDVFKNQ
jgi:hypothetical protein